MYIPFVDKPFLERFVAEWNERHSEKEDQILLEFKDYQNYPQTFKIYEAPIIKLPNFLAAAAFDNFLNEHNKNCPNGNALNARVVGGGAPEKENFPRASFSYSKWAKGDIVVQLVGPQFRAISVNKEMKPDHIPGAKAVLSSGAAAQQWETDETAFKLKLSRTAPPLMHLVANGENEIHGSAKGFSSINDSVHYKTRARNGIIERIYRDGSREHLQADGKTYLPVPGKHPCPNILFSSNLGLFGITLEVGFECLEAYYVNAKIEKRNWTAVKKEIRDPKDGLFQVDDATHCMIVPSGKPNEAKSDYKDTVVYRENRVSLAEHALTSIADTSAKMAPNKSFQRFTDKINDAIKLGKRLHTFREFSGDFNEYFVGLIEIGSQDETAYGPSFKIQHYLGGYPHGTYDTSFVTEDDPNCEGMITRIDGSFEVLQEPEFQKELPITVMFCRRVKAHNMGGISAFAQTPGSAKVDKNANDYVAFAGNRTYFRYQERLAEKVYPDAATHYGKMQPPGFNVPKHYGAGYVEFVKALAFDECKSLEEFNELKFNPNDKIAWRAVLEKIHHNPYLNMELDEFLHLEKYTPEERAEARAEEKAMQTSESEYNPSKTLEKLIEDIKAFHREHHDQEIEHHAPGLSLIGKLEKHLSTLRGSVKAPDRMFSSKPATVMPSNAAGNKAANEAKLIENQDPPQKKGCFGLCGTAV